MDNRNIQWTLRWLISSITATILGITGLITYTVTSAPSPDPRVGRIAEIEAAIRGVYDSPAGGARAKLLAEYGARLQEEYDAAEHRSDACPRCGRRSVKGETLTNAE